MQRWGNARANRYWEHGLPADHAPEDARVESFIRQKCRRTVRRLRTGKLRERTYVIFMPMFYCQTSTRSLCGRDRCRSQKRWMAFKLLLLQLQLLRLLQKLRL